MHGRNNGVKNVPEGAAAGISETFTIKFFRFSRKCTKKLDRFSVFFSHKSDRRRSLMAKLQPSKLVLSVRFRPPAPAGGVGCLECISGGSGENAALFVDFGQKRVDERR